MGYNRRELEMKKALFLISSLCISVVCFTSCGGSKPVAQTQNQTGMPFGDTYEAPCTMYDTPEEFAATGIYKGSMEQKGEVQKFALANAQQLVRMKMQHAYKGMVSDFSQTMGNNRGNDITTKMNAAGDQIIDVVVNNTSACCIKWSTIDEGGRLECYCGIKISKADLSKKIAKEVSDALTEEEKLKIQFDELQYREQMDERFSKFEENN